jgi:sulfite reductase alpha subunit-like flavoprotein
LVKRIIGDENGYFYICGNTVMGHEVQNILHKIIGDEAFTKLEKEKRLIKELWG